MTAGTSVAAGEAALAAGRWEEARRAFEEAIAGEETPGARLGLAGALWWLGENRESLAEATRAFSLSRRAGDVGGAVRAAVWLAITYKANFANRAAAAGWLGRAERLLEPLPAGPLHGWVWVARAYGMEDLDEAEELTGRAMGVARAAGDVDLEVTALAQLGLIRVGQGSAQAGFGLLDEAMAAALGGEATTLDTVVYACCDMLHACELTSDVERAAQWCRVADDFVSRYGCPFLYGECRIYYGSVLAAEGRWEAAERELAVALRITAESCPALHSTALARLARLRVGQGRLEEAAALLSRLGGDVQAESDETLAVAALLLARGDAPGAGRHLEHRLDRLARRRLHLVAALDLLVDAHLSAGDGEAASATMAKLAEAAAAMDGDRPRALAAAARGRVALAAGDGEAGIADLERALGLWSRLESPFEVARTRAELARGLAGDRPDVAVEHARHALAAFEDLGAPLDADRVAALLRRLGHTPRTGRRGAAGLTTREEEVLRLLGAGLSNPEIAARLHVSRKTASHHVSRILAKLNLRNRAEAAAYAAARAHATTRSPGADG